MNIVKVNLEIEMAKAKVKSISELARRTEISRHSLTKYCSPEGMIDITLKNLLKICSVLDCKIEDIIEVK
ncbi:helix-turn-helix domain-containing protein [Clostridium botulinum]|uniref:helix-turn-helix domain-containing protein n=2 Tax=Clostridium botulinum TaxID=1491 RepID=UPI0004D011D7|nr:helix-turn-helix transcriptional regulator [Clostridium botulinum]APC82192.1 helix-turn-helix family protein [Clostridium botulinum]